MSTITTDPITLEARAEHPAFAVPGAMDALQALGKAVQGSGLPPRTAELVSLRASQINGCGVCAVQHPRIAKKFGETEDRLHAVAAWRDAPYFDGAERAALALTEAATRIADRGDPARPPPRRGRRGPPRGGPPPARGGGGAGPPATTTRRRSRGSCSRSPAS